MSSSVGCHGTLYIYMYMYIFVYTYRMGSSVGCHGTLNMYIYAKLIDNFSHASDVTSLKTPF